MRGAFSSLSPGIFGAAEAGSLRRRSRLAPAVSRIKERVEEKEGIPPPQQRLIFGGKQMSDDKKASEYNIEGCAAHCCCCRQPFGARTHTAVSATRRRPAPLACVCAATRSGSVLHLVLALRGGC